MLVPVKRFLRCPFERAVTIIITVNVDEAIPLEIGMYVFADKWYKFGNKLYQPRFNFQVTEAMMPDRMHVVLEE